MFTKQQNEAMERLFSERPSLSYEDIVQLRQAVEQAKAIVDNNAHEDNLARQFGTGEAVYRTKDGLEAVGELPTGKILTDVRRPCKTNCSMEAVLHCFEEPIIRTYTFHSFRSVRGQRLPVYKET